MHNVRWFINSKYKAQLLLPSQEAHSGPPEMGQAANHRKLLQHIGSLRLRAQLGTKQRKPTPAGKGRTRSIP